MVAEAERAEPRRTGPGSARTGAAPRRAGRAGSAPSMKQVQRVDLGDDGLRPEGVGAGQQQAATRPARAPPAISAPTRTTRPTATAASDGRCEVGARAGSTGSIAHDQAGDGEVERVALAGGQQAFARDRLERGGVAQVLAGQQRGAVEDEGDGRHEGGGQEARGVARLAPGRCVRPWRRAAAGLGRVLRLDREVGAHPLGDAALQHRHAVALPDERGGHFSRGDLVRVRVVDDDVAVLGDLGEVWEGPGRRGPSRAAGRCCVRRGISAGRRGRRLRGGVIALEPLLSGLPW